MIGPRETLVVDTAVLDPADHVESPMNVCQTELERHTEQQSKRFGRAITVNPSSIDSNGAVIIPPIIGAAIRRMTSEPVPLRHMMGRSPAMSASPSQ